MKNYSIISKRVFLNQSRRLVLDLAENLLSYPQSRELTVTDIGSIKLTITSETITITVAGILRNSKAAERMLDYDLKVAIIHQMINDAEALLADGTVA